MPRVMFATLRDLNLTEERCGDTFDAVYNLSGHHYFLARHTQLLLERVQGLLSRLERDALSAGAGGAREQLEEAVTLVKVSVKLTDEILREWPKVVAAIRAPERGGEE